MKAIVFLSSCCLGASQDLFLEAESPATLRGIAVVKNLEKESGAEGIKQAASDSLALGQHLYPGDALISAGAVATLKLQTDGNLVLRQNGQSLWSSKTEGHEGTYLQMQKAGNLVLYDSNGSIWSSGRHAGTSKAVLGDDCDLRLIDSSGAHLWDLKTECSAPTPAPTPTPTPAPSDALNLLLIISDQHRWDCLGEAGNTVIHTPNLDQLTKDGVHFTKAYTICPVCAPARTSMLAGRTPEQTKVRGNNDIDTAPREMTYDRVLLEGGWSAEYKGKFHSPYIYTRDDNDKTYYNQPVQWLNGKGPENPPEGCQSLSDAYRSYLNEHEPLKQLQRGQLLDKMYQRPYWADIADLRYSQAFNDTLLQLTNRLISEGHANHVETTDQQHVNGRLALSAEHSYSALTLDDGLAALDRLKDSPFALTVSFEAPHPPFLVPSPFYGLYPSGSIPDPVTGEDPMTASPYHDPHNPSGDEDQVRQQSSNYYGMIAQNDQMVGVMLDKLEELKLTSKTLVIYISDHGEMLGDHHMQSKMVFYEGSAHIPLIMRLPGVIPAGKVVDLAVSNLALFGTIVDYLGRPDEAPASSKSLRPLIEGTDDTEQVIFSFWDSDNSPGYMAFDGRFKLMIGRKQKTTSGVDALYDLRYDPEEVINLLRSPYVQRHLSELHPEEQDDVVPHDKAQSLQKALVDWLKETGSEHASAVAQREMNIGHINQVPMLVAPLLETTWKVGQANFLTVPQNTFLDVDDDELTFAGTLDRNAFPEWLSINPKDGSVQGTPPKKGNHLLRLTASDQTGSAFAELQLKVE